MFGYNVPREIEELGGIEEWYIVEAPEASFPNSPSGRESAGQFATIREREIRNSNRRSGFAQLLRYVRKKSAIKPS